MKHSYLITAFALLVLAGCSAPDEGGGSTATPANKLDRPLPEETVGGTPAGTLPGKP